MLTKFELKDIQSLYHKKQRDEQKLFIAEGPKLAEELIAGGIEIKQVFALTSWIKENPHLSLHVKEISEVELNRMSQLQTPNEVLVIAKQQAPAEEPEFEDRLTLVLDGIQDPGNMGTIIRIADWFGIKQMICSNDCVDRYNAKVVQSTMGSIVRTQCWYKDFKLWTLPAGIPVFGALLNGRDVYKVSKPKEGILVIGNESKGIRQPLLSSIDVPLTIPKIGGAESLNAAVATGIIVGCLVNNVT